MQKIKHTEKRGNVSQCVLRRYVVANPTVCILAYLTRGNKLIFKDLVSESVKETPERSRH